MKEQSRINEIRLADDPLAPAQPGAPRQPYYAPTLEYLGGWSTLTLQQSVPVGFFSDLP
jgi:hypothetical protein